MTRPHLLNRLKLVVQDLVERSGLRCYDRRIQRTYDNHLLSWYCEVQPQNGGRNFFYIELRITEECIFFKVNQNGYDGITDSADPTPILHDQIGPLTAGDSWIESRLSLDIKHAIMETVGVLDQIAWGIDASISKDEAHKSQ